MSKYKVQFSNNFKKSLKRMIKQGKDTDKLLDVVDKLVNKEVLDAKYRNHNLINDKYFKNCKECHIEPNWLLIYKYVHEKLVLILVSTGSHSDLFQN